jgi:hypothetical protein
MDKELEELKERFPPSYFANFTGYVLKILIAEGYLLKIVDYCRWVSSKYLCTRRPLCMALSYLLRHHRLIGIECLFWRELDPYWNKTQEPIWFECQRPEYEKLLREQPYLRRLYYGKPEFEEEFKKEEQILTQLDLNPNLVDVVRGLLYPVIVHRDAGVVAGGVPGAGQDGGSESDSGVESVDSGP